MNLFCRISTALRAVVVAFVAGLATGLVVAVPDLSTTPAVVDYQVTRPDSR